MTGYFVHVVQYLGFNKEGVLRGKTGKESIKGLIELKALKSVRVGELDDNL